MIISQYELAYGKYAVKFLIKQWNILAVYLEIVKMSVFLQNYQDLEISPSMKTPAVALTMKKNIRLVCPLEFEWKNIRIK